jgi:SRSO17 transposase
MQRSISKASWDEEKMLARYHVMVADEIGEENGVLIFDESGFPKKGDDSAGVARQYCGRLGKVENCQVGVFAAYASSQGYVLVDRELYIPEKWFGPECEERRAKTDMPEDLSFKAKGRIAAEMLTAIADQGILPFRYIMADSVYGQSPDFIEAAEHLVGTTYFVSLASDTLCWPTAPVAIIKQSRRGTSRQTKTVVLKPESPPVKVRDIAKGLHDTFWYRRTVSEGAKGPIVYEFSKREVTLAQGGKPWKQVFLIMKRTIGRVKEYSYFISNAGRSARLPLFVWLSGMRWPIEQCFREAKTELGMDHYEVRKYPGWNHHMLISMLAHFFLWHLKIRLGKKSTIHYAVEA